MHIAIGCVLSRYSMRVWYAARGLQSTPPPSLLLLLSRYLPDLGRERNKLEAVGHLSGFSPKRGQLEVRK